jgi:Xaa-Pro aminopeptidase
MPKAMPARIKRSTALFPAMAVDGLLVTIGSDIRYLTQYPAHDSWLLITPREAFYITDGRYIEEVKKALCGVTPVRFGKSIFEETALLCAKVGVRRLGVDERYLTVDHFKKLKAVCGRKTSLVTANACVDRLRMIKGPDELVLIREALALNLKAYRFIQSLLKPGVREKDILARLEAFIHKHGVGFSFDPIIASGPNSAYPHARVTERKLCSKEPVLIDLGIDVKGYKSDLTRMFFLDKMPASFKEHLLAVRGAQEEAFKVIRPGIKAADVDAAARNYLKKHGLGEYFTHSLGHGVGLEIHEAPWISATSQAVLEEGMIFTVEPGIYFPGKYGIRLEEMVRVTQKGCEVLSANYDQ